MATVKDGTFLRQFRTLYNLGAIGHLTDGQLLERFSSDSGEGAELAFAALVERHAGLVLRVCRARLGDSHDAQDAFQATFLVLVKKARTLWVRDSIGPWLHQVAFRTASCARISRMRRRRLEQGAAIVEAVEAPDVSGWERALHEEISLLPDRYRLPIILCDLQGRSCEEAARQMGRPVGTIKSWRSRGRDRLRIRLARLGMAPATLASEVAKAQDSIPKNAVARAARTITDAMTTGMIPVSATSPANGVLKAMILSKFRMTAVASVSCMAIATGLGAFAASFAHDPPKAVAPDTAKVKDVDEVWPLTLNEAIRIGLNNSRAIRVLNPDAAVDTLQIVPSDASVDGFRFKSEVLAHVRSVEQQYWALNLQNVEYWATETAVDLTEQIVKREEAKILIGSGNANELDEARQQLERFKLDFVDKTANLINTERQLGHLLGLPPTDKRRIVPVTPPREDRIGTDWEDCRKVMLDQQPDLLRASAIAREAKGEDAIKRQEELGKQVRQQVEHSLARFFLEVDSNHKLYQTAGRLKAAARQRLDAQRTLHESGKLTIDRYLDAVNRWSTAVAQEADYKARYNTAIAALEEAKGSLLGRDGISIVEAPRLVNLTASTKDRMVEPASFIDPKAAKPALAPAPVKSDRSGTTYSFKLSIGAGPKPFTVGGSFTVAPAATPTDR